LIKLLIKNNIPELVFASVLSNNTQKTLELLHECLKDENFETLKEIQALQADIKNPIIQNLLLFSEFGYQKWKIPKELLNTGMENEKDENDKTSLFISYGFSWVINPYYFLKNQK
jgi:hypothetical protein